MCTVVMEFGVVLIRLSGCFNVYAGGLVSKMIICEVRSYEFEVHRCN